MIVDERYIGSAEAGRLLGVGPSAVRKYVRLGRLTPIKLDASRNYFLRSQVETLAADPPRNGRPRKERNDGAA